MTEERSVMAGKGKGEMVIYMLRPWRVRLEKPGFSEETRVLATGQLHCFWKISNLINLFGI